MSLTPSYKAWAIWTLLLVVTAWAYWPGLYGPALLDDAVNLRPLNQLEQNADYAADVIRGNRSGLGRPVSMASFTLERLYFDRGTYGQKQVGLFLHFLNATLVLLLSRALLRRASQAYSSQCALLIAGLWLTLPLLLSSTLYVIQRMTLLSALFSLSAMLCYCRGRAQLSRISIVWFLLSVLCVLLAALAKENGVLAVPMIVVIEVFIYGFRDERGEMNRGLLYAHGALVALPLLLFLYLLASSPEFFLKGYQVRDFSLGERLMTQPVVLWDYLSQILWADVHRLGLYHDDFPVSQGLFKPAGTAMAVAFWVVVLVAALASAAMRRYRLLAFGFAFFLAGHIMESTFFPLELYFEHRNYLPAFGILFGIVAAANQVLARLPPLRGWLLLLAGLLLSRNLLALGSQAVVWSDVRTVSMEAANHHPESERALLGLAEVYAYDGHLGAAIPLMEKANIVAAREGASAEVLEAIFYCLSGQALPRDIFTTAELMPEEVSELHFGDHVYQLVRLVISGRCPPESGVLFADSMATWLRVESGAPFGTSQIYGSLLLLENQLERHERALRYAKIMISKRPNDVMALQFSLYLSQVLDRPEVGESAKRALVALRDQGKLSRQETANLELFLETAEPNNE